MAGQGQPGPAQTTGVGALHPVREGSHRHHGIMQWLMLNPDRTLKECALELGYTQAWLSTIIHSDMFQVEYQEMCRQSGIVAVHTIQTKLGLLAAKALEKSIERIDNGSASERFLGDTIKNVLPALGYTKAGEGGVHLHRHEHFEVPRESLERAREAAQRRREGLTPVKNNGLWDLAEPAQGQEVIVIEPEPEPVHTGRV